MPQPCQIPKHWPEWREESTHGGSDTEEQELFPEKHDRMEKTLGFLALPQRVSKEGGHHDGDTVIDRPHGLSLGSWNRAESVAEPGTWLCLGIYSLHTMGGIKGRECINCRLTWAIFFWNLQGILRDRKERHRENRTVRMPDQQLQLGSDHGQLSLCPPISHSDTV